MNGKNLIFRRALLIALALWSPPAYAAVKLPGIFSDHMVLQRDIPVKVWGTARPAEKVQVTLGNQHLSTVASKSGNWHVEIEEQLPGGPFELKVQGDNQIVFKDVQIGDVFIVAGQSELLDPLKSLKSSAGETVNNSKLRYFVVPKRTSANPSGTLAGSWKPSAPGGIGDCSIIGYNLGRELQSKLKVAVGIIDASYAESPIASWVSKDRLNQMSVFRSVFNPTTNAIAAAEVVAPGKATLSSVAKPCVAYNGMVAPLVGYGVKAVCWYQGLNDLGQAVSYKKLLPMLIRDWRARWAQEPDIPFFFVQLPSSEVASTNFDINTLPACVGATNSWISLRDAQASALAVGSTAMVVTTDYKDHATINDTKGLSHRLANAIMAKLFEGKETAFGPLYEGYDKEGSAIKVHFANASNGLKLDFKAGQPTGFEMIDTKGKIFPAEARVVDHDIAITSAQVLNPIEVRYDWKDAAQATLFNTENLPAAPFRINIRN